MVPEFCRNCNFEPLHLGYCVFPVNIMWARVCYFFVAFFEFFSQTKNPFQAQVLSTFHGHSETFTDILRGF